MYDVRVGNERVWKEIESEEKGVMIKRAGIALDQSILYIVHQRWVMEIWIKHQLRSAWIKTSQRELRSVLWPSNHPSSMCGSNSAY